MIKWEYKVVERLCEMSSLSSIEAGDGNRKRRLIALDNLGREGWEMCGNLGRLPNGFIFKRKLEE